MARIAPVAPGDFALVLAEATGHPDESRRVALGSLTVWARRPEVAVAFLAFQRALDESTTLPVRLRELVRLRVAFHNRCRSCMAVRSAAAVADGMDEGAVCSLERPEEAADLSEAERAALRYADLMATDHLGVDDELFDRLRRHFTEDELVELGAHIGTCVGFGRLAATWDLVDDLPPAFAAGAAPTPWAAGSVVR